MTDPMGTIPLFALPQPEVLKPARTIRQADKDGRASWTAFTGARRPCDECVMFLHENGGHGPHPRSARRVRAVKGTGERLFLCREHARPREETDKQGRK